MARATQLFWAHSGRTIHIGVVVAGLVAITLLLWLLTAAASRPAAAADKPLQPGADEVIVVVGMRVHLPERVQRDFFSRNSMGLNWNLTWAPFDVSTDARVKDRSDDITVRLGLDADRSRCRLEEDVQYCVLVAKVGFYVLASVELTAEKFGNRRVDRRTKYRYGSMRTSLGVGKGAGGYHKIDDSIPVSESGAQRFVLAAAQVNYLGEYSLSPYGQLVELRFDPERAKRVLVDVAGVDGKLGPPHFFPSYRLQLRTGFCPHQYWIEPEEDAYDQANPCDER